MRYPVGQLGLVLLLSACGVGSRVDPTALNSDAALVTSSSSVFAELTKTPPAVRSQLLARVGAMSVGSYYKMLLASVSNRSLTVDGVAFHGAAASLTGEKASYEALGQHFSSMRQVWNELHMDPETLSLATVQALIKDAAPQQKAGFGLEVTFDPEQRVRPASNFGKGPGTRIQTCAGLAHQLQLDGNAVAQFLQTAKPDANEKISASSGKRTVSARVQDFFVSNIRVSGVDNPSTPAKDSSAFAKCFSNLRDVSGRWDADMKTVQNESAPTS